MSRSLLQVVPAPFELKGLRTGLGPLRVRLPLAWQAHGSIGVAARACCNGAWVATAALDAFAITPPVPAGLGDAGGGGARLTEPGVDRWRSTGRGARCGIAFYREPPMGFSTSCRHG